MKILSAILSLLFGLLLVAWTQGLVSNPFDAIAEPHELIPIKFCMVLFILYGFITLFLERENVNALLKKVAAKLAK